jgi:ubiquinone/menaquinone biosynthesis C-methylase UbiE
MTEASRVADRPELTSDERAYYALNARAWPIFAPLYDFVVAPFRRIRPEVVSLAGVSPSSRVLDVATGTGAQAYAFAERAGTVVGVDLCEAMLRIATRKRRAENLTYRQGDATALPFPDASFDVACISFALHEMPRSIRERALAEMVRVTVLDGTIAIVDYAPPRDAVERAIGRFVRLYEGQRYVDFVQSDLGAFLRSAGIDIREERRFLRGVVRAVVGVRTRAQAP